MKQHCAAAVLLACTAPCLSLAADIGFYAGIEAGQGRTQLELQDDVLTGGILLGTSSEREDRTFGLYGGYSFTKHFAVELAYADLGETSYKTTRDIAAFPFPSPFPFPVTAAIATPSLNAATYFTAYPGAAGYTAALFLEERTTTLESELLSLSLRGRYELGAGFSVIGSAGIAVHRIESTLRFRLSNIPVRVIGGDNETTAGAGVLGLGAEWSFHPDWAVRLQAQRHFLLEDEEINLVYRGDVTTVTGGIEYRF